MPDKINKSEMVREYLNKHKDATAKQVVEALASKSVEVQEQTVYAQMRKLQNPDGSAPRATTEKISVELLTDVQALIKKHGLAPVSRVLQLLS